MSKFFINRPIVAMVISIVHGHRMCDYPSLTLSGVAVCEHRSARSS